TPKAPPPGQLASSAAVDSKLKKFVRAARHVTMRSRTLHTGTWASERFAALPEQILLFFGEYFCITFLSRVWFNVRTRAFQARGGGSIPSASSIPKVNSPV